MVVVVCVCVGGCGLWRYLLAFLNPNYWQTPAPFICKICMRLTEVQMFGQIFLLGNNQVTNENRRARKRKGQTCPDCGSHVWLAISRPCKDHDFRARVVGEQLHHEDHLSHPDSAVFKFNLGFCFWICFQVFKNRLTGCRLTEIDLATSLDLNCFISKLEVLFNLLLFLTSRALIDLVSFHNFANRNRVGLLIPISFALIW